MARPSIRGPGTHDRCSGPIAAAPSVQNAVDDTPYFGLNYPGFPMPEGPNVEGPPAITVREVASYLNVDEKTVYRLAKRGELPGFKVAGTWRFRMSDIDTWIEQRKAEAASSEDARDQSGTARARTATSKRRE